MKFENKRCLVAYYSRAGYNYVSGNIINLSVGNTEIIANIKKEKRVTEIVNQIGLSDIKNAIQRGKKISEDNQGKEANKTPKENRYYDNPDTQMHVLLQFLFAKVGINIDALG